MDEYEKTKSYRGIYKTLYSQKRIVQRLHSIVQKIFDEIDNEVGAMHMTQRQSLGASN